jgi:hypothetical protein
LTESPDWPRAFRRSYFDRELVDEDRIWPESHLLDVEIISRDPGLCASALLGSGRWLGNDARNDPRTLTNSLVAGELGLQFCARVPLPTQDGYNLLPGR